MHQSGCFRDNALELIHQSSLEPMHLTWCTRAEALELIHLDKVDKVDKDTTDKDKVNKDKFHLADLSRIAF